jgi:hypothetical protein
VDGGGYMWRWFMVVEVEVHIYIRSRVIYEMRVWALGEY